MKNLNRQLLYYSAIGDNKAIEAAEKLQMIGKDVEVMPYPENITEKVVERLLKKEYAAVFSCVDNWKSRKLINQYCVETSTPMFDGGVTSFDGDLRTYIPGESDCLDCRTGYDDLIDDEIENFSCRNLSANVVMPNAIVGALMAAESMRFIGHVSDGVNDRTNKVINIPAPEGNTFLYRSNDNYKRFMQVETKKICRTEKTYENRCFCRGKNEVCYAA